MANYDNDDDVKPTVVIGGPDAKQQAAATGKPAAASDSGILTLSDFTNGVAPLNEEAWQAFLDAQKDKGKGPHRG